jgi:hypothetical protein
MTTTLRGKSKEYLRMNSNQHKNTREMRKKIHGLMETVKNKVSSSRPPIFKQCPHGLRYCNLQMLEIRLIFPLLGRELLNFLTGN